MKYASLVSGVAALVLALPAVHAQAIYKKDVPDSLARKATITEASAAAMAHKRFPKAQIDAVELENENGKLIWSYDMKTAGKSGIDEVNIDARTGKLVGVGHESPASEKKEAAADAKAQKAKKP
jgi:hypothetical protein